MARKKAAFDAGRFFLDRAYQYAEDIKHGDIVACRLVKLAVNRFYADLEHASERGFVFDENAAAKVFRFIYKHCKHYQGEWAGQPIELSGWQCFIVANVFGWVHASNGLRRFRIVYEEVARKNGKTTKLGGVGTYLVASDNEPGAKVYCAATKRDQAKEIFECIANIAKKDVTLKRAMKPTATTIACETKNSPGSKVELLSKDYNSMDGFNVHGALVDELHAHRDSGIWDVLESARGARRQPLMWGITTAGKNHQSFCYEMRAHAIKVLEGSIPVESCDNYFAIIYTLDEEDDWTDPACWIKANPNLGVSVNLDDMIDQCHKAKEMPTARIEFQTKRLNMWVYGESTWMNMEKWNACQNKAFNELPYWRAEGKTDMDGRTCFGGLDLASTEDLVGLSFTFPLADGKWRFIARGYLPQAAFDRRLKTGGQLAALYQRFREMGLLVITPGETCDYTFIERDILIACQRFNVKEVAFDRFNSSQLVTNLMGQDVPMIAMGQGTGSINAPMKELLRLVLKGLVEHNNPLLTFTMSNVVAVMNAAGDIKYDKSKVSEKIDPAAASIMALGRAMVVPDDYNPLDDLTEDELDELYG